MLAPRTERRAEATEVSEEPHVGLKLSFTVVKEIIFSYFHDDMGEFD